MITGVPRQSFGDLEWYDMARSSASRMETSYFEQGPSRLPGGEGRGLGDRPSPLITGEMRLTVWLLLRFAVEKVRLMVVVSRGVSEPELGGVMDHIVLLRMRLKASSWRL